MTEFYALNLSQDTLSRISQQYIENQNEQSMLANKGAEKFIKNHCSLIETKIDEVARLSLPRRKRWLGYLPLSFEMGFIQNPYVMSLIIEKLADENTKIGNLLHRLSEQNPDVQNFLTGVQNLYPTCNTNLGALDHTLYSHRFEMLGAPLFSITDSLAEQLMSADIGKSTPCYFLKCPFPMQYIEYGMKPFPGIQIYNEASQWHDFEGMYVNSYTLTEDEIAEEIAEGKLSLDSKVLDNSNNMIAYALESGFIKNKCGDLTVLEILATGSPHNKENNFDDTTLSFTLLYQDTDMSVVDLIDWHVKFYKRELDCQKKYYKAPSYEALNLNVSSIMSDNDAQSMESIVLALTKSLLYINAENGIRKEVKDYTKSSLEVSRLKNKAKQRKAKSRNKGKMDYIRIGPESDTTNHLTTSKSGKKATHWRRAHFREQAYGKGRELRKIKWIPRAIINASSIEGMASKDYRVS